MTNKRKKIKNTPSFENPSVEQIKQIASILKSNQNALIFTSNEEGVITINDVVSYKERERTDKISSNLTILTFGLLWLGLPRNLPKFAPIIKDAFLEYDGFVRQRSEELIAKANTQSSEILPEDMKRIIPSGNA